LGARQAGMDATACYITGQIDYTDIILLLDSGCSKSIIPTQLYQQFNRRCASPLTPITGEGVLADRSRPPIEGNTTVTLRIGSKAYTQSFLVANLQQYILLGLDFFIQHNCHLDFKGTRFTHSDVSQNCCDAFGEPIRVNVHLTQYVEIPPYSELMIPACINQHWTPQVAYIEANSPDKNLLVAASNYQSKDNYIWVRACNISSDTLELPQGKTFVTCSQAQIIDDVGTNSLDHRILPPQLERLLQSTNLNHRDKQKAKLLLQKHQDIFSMDKYDLGCTNLARHQIPLVDGARPIKQRPYKHGLIQEEEIE